MAGKPAAASPENSEDAKGGLWFWLGRLRNDYSSRKHRVIMKWKQDQLLGCCDIILFHFLHQHTFKRRAKILVRGPNSSKTLIAGKPDQKGKSAKGGCSLWLGHRVRMKWNQKHLLGRWDFFFAKLRFPLYKNTAPTYFQSASPDLG